MRIALALVVVVVGCLAASASEAAPVRCPEDAYRHTFRGEGGDWIEACLRAGSGRAVRHGPFRRYRADGSPAVEGF